MINQAITQVANGNHLSEKEMTAVMEMFLSGMAAPAQIGAFITALRMKGETVEEITGAAKAMQAKTRKIEIDESLINIDRDEINVEEETILDTAELKLGVQTVLFVIINLGAPKTAKNAKQGIIGYTCQMPANQMAATIGIIG